MREEIREKGVKIRPLLRGEGSVPPPRMDVKKAMKLIQKRVKLIQKLNIRALIMPAMIDFYRLANVARMMNIFCENDPNIYKQEALKYAKIFGDHNIYYYNSITSLVNQ